MALNLQQLHSAVMDEYRQLTGDISSLKDLCKHFATVAGVNQEQFNQLMHFTMQSHAEILDNFKARLCLNVSDVYEHFCRHRSAFIALAEKFEAITGDLLANQMEMAFSSTPQANAVPSYWNLASAGIYQFQHEDLCFVAVHLRRVAGLLLNATLRIRCVAAFYRDIDVEDVQDGTINSQGAFNFEAMLEPEASFIPNEGFKPNWAVLKALEQLQQGQK